MTYCPLISVIMGTYNPTQSDIKRAVESIIQQSEPDWELIIYDDGSDENKKAIINEIANLDRRIKILVGKSNKGLAHALNECLSVAKGQFIARMDDDDYSSPDRFSAQISFLKCHPEYSWVGSNAYLFDKMGIWGVGNRIEKPLKKDFLKYSPFIHPSVMFRTDILRQIGGYCDSKRNAKCEDYELFFRLYSKGFIGYNLMDNLYYYQEEYNSIKKRTIKDSWNEMNIRRRGFKSLGMSTYYTFPYIIKPLVIFMGSINSKFLQFLRKKRINGDSSINKNTLKQISDKRSRMYYKSLASSRYLAVPYLGTALSLENDIYKSNMSVLAPTINGFVAWIISEAKKKEVTRLYFLSRDGYIPYLVAKKYCLYFGIDIECKYLFCSRYSLRLPLYHCDIDEALNHVCRGGINVTLRKILLRSGISDSTKQHIVANQLHNSYSLDDTISYSDLQKVKDSLSSCYDYLSFMKDASLQAWEPLEGYLRQEGLFEDCCIAIVDSGWTGTTQLSLQTFLNKCNSQNVIQGFYFGLYEVPNSSDASQYHCYYFSSNKGLLNKIFFCNCLFEAVFSAPHGTTIGYRKDSTGVYSPLLYDSEQNNHVFNKSIEKDVVNYTDELLSYAKSAPCPIEIKKARRATQKLLRLFMWSPNAEEASTYGDLFFSDDLLDDNIQHIATRMTRGELMSNHILLKALILSGVIKMPIKESAWYEASSKISSTFSFPHRVSYAIYKAAVYLRKQTRKGGRDI